MKRLVTMILAVAVVGMTAPAFAEHHSPYGGESAEYGLVDDPIWQLKTGREPGNLIDLLGLTDGKKSTSNDSVFAGGVDEEVPHGEQGS